jgi:hypothetical protein
MLGCAAFTGGTLNEHGAQNVVLLKGGGSESLLSPISYSLHKWN